jgi:hypothetical protein
MLLDIYMNDTHNYTPVIRKDSLVNRHLLVAAKVLGSTYGVQVIASITISRGPHFEPALGINVNLPGANKGVVDPHRIISHPHLIGFITTLDTLRQPERSFCHQSLREPNTRSLWLQPPLPHVAHIDSSIA